MDDLNEYLMKNRIAYQPKSLCSFEQIGSKYRCIINLPDGLSSMSEMCSSKKEANHQAAKKLLDKLKVSTTSTPIVNWRGKLQEYCQKMGWPIPAYDTVLIPDRPPHLPLFQSTVTVNNKGYKLDENTTTKKEAERLVSCIAYKALTGENVDQEVSPPTLLVKKEESPESDESDSDSTGPFDDSE